MPKISNTKHEISTERPHYRTLHVINIYNIRRNVTHHIVEDTVLALYLPSAFCRKGKRGKPSKADKIHKDFIDKYQDNDA